MSFTCLYKPLNYATSFDFHNKLSLPKLYYLLLIFCPLGFQKVRSTDWEGSSGYEESVWVGTEEVKAEIYLHY